MYIPVLSTITGLTGSSTPSSSCCLTRRSRSLVTFSSTVCT